MIKEFVICWPHTNRHSALKAAEKMRTQIEQYSLIQNGVTIAITVSCGITQLLKGDTHELAFERADQALYRAKEQGRNQCCLSLVHFVLS